LVDKQQLLVADIRAWRAWLEENHSSPPAPGADRFARHDNCACARCGDGTTAAASSDEAWAMISRHKPSVVLLDVQMPGRTGLEVLAMIRGDPSLSTTRVIMLTAKALKADLEVGLAAGADLYLTKPFSPLDLLTRVDEALVQWRSDQPPGSLYTPAA
jgi:CheY-like chemotaxis protein